MRLTYNRAFSSPDPSQLFSDFVRGSLLGYPYAVRSSSIPRSGYTFPRDSIRSPFNTAGPQGYLALEYEAEEDPWAAVPRLLTQMKRVLQN